MWPLLAGMKDGREIKVKIHKRKNQSKNLADLLLDLSGGDYCYLTTFLPAPALGEDAIYVTTRWLHV